jgi:hypothetical protein
MDIVIYLGGGASVWKNGEEEKSLVPARKILSSLQRPDIAIWNSKLMTIFFTPNTKHVWSSFVLYFCNAGTTVSCNPVHQGKGTYCSDEIRGDLLLPNIEWKDSSPRIFH